MLLDDLYEIVEPITADLGYILWGIEVVGAGKLTIRIFIDHENGVSVDDCQVVSKEVSAIFDVEDPISDKYVLEVSSPGMNRQIFNIVQAQALVGFNVKAVTITPVESQTKFKGVLERVEGNNVILKLDDGREVSFDFDELKKFRVSPDFS
ncbi:ribosome maturation factor RimP [Francisella noatunensis]|uniref:Ribosome maturation factor RimP n=1 Tax=Francisella noatunensis TaxID=657445 RepID=A0A9Q2QHS2_9GAMM|nr:ribosome maturation factor RimP [Francisella noatunensis]MBK2028903.1 ribosome maturation factor RimP [Francisella noatunensis]MBK2033308.1 ribosome maturation factor RimP [Francisella noatunensis]MBK2048060.1 ribosome maturation factor RimP [Francisella noatunensis]MBK2050310.1 ribosome maturation factor RimP [Francisella noatunensis]MBK2051616.1 ribosome maturation factor RimP [Francisella noatunensis]